MDEWMEPECHQESFHPPYFLVGPNRGFEPTFSPDSGQTLFHQTTEFFMILKQDSAWSYIYLQAASETMKSLHWPGICWKNTKMGYFYFSRVAFLMWSSVTPFYSQIMRVIFRNSHFYSCCWLKFPWLDLLKDLKRSGFGLHMCVRPASACSLRTPVTHAVCVNQETAAPQ